MRNYVDRGGRWVVYAVAELAMKPSGAQFLFSFILFFFLLSPQKWCVCVGGWQYDLRVALPLIATAAFPIMPGFDRIAIWSYQKIV